MSAPAPQAAPLPWWKEITQPFVDLVHAPRALWGVNLAYMLEGLSYFGILTYLAMHFSDFIFQGVPNNDVWAHNMVGVLTAGIAIAMVVLGFIPDRWGVRRSLIFAFSCLLIGRIVMSGAPSFFAPAGVGSTLHLVTMGGILLILLGYGLYQPAAYSAVRQFTTPKTASMAYAMLYALMNGGSALAMGAFLLRDEDFLGLGIVGTFWVYTALTLVALLTTALILSKKTVIEAIEGAKKETELLKAVEPNLGAQQPAPAATLSEAPARVPVTAWIVLAGILAAIGFRTSGNLRLALAAGVLSVPVLVALLPRGPRTRVLRKMAGHPLADTKFFAFIFALIPVQTLFTYNWLVLPQYIERSYTGVIGKYFEIASNANPILIFFLVPIITALTYRRKVYSMMISGTLVMAGSAFILAIGANPVTLMAYIVVMTIGEAMWSARFLQYATEIAPPDRAGQYQGVAQLPWFLTKFLVPLLYSGRMMEKYCPADGPKDTETMWLIFGVIAMVSPAILILAKGWLGKDFKHTHG